MAFFQLVIAVSTLIVLCGCQVNPTGPARSALQSSSPTHHPLRATLPVAEPGGRLAYIGGDGNVYLTSADRESTLALTNDATTFPEGDGYSYHRLAWSPHGQLAFAAMNRAGNRFQGRLYVAEPIGSTPRLVGQSDERFIIYIYWSPAPCLGQRRCHRLAYLVEEANSIALRVVQIEAGRVDNWLAGQGRPFYFSWAPNGQQMLWHTGGAYRHNDAARLTRYDVGRNRAQPLPDRTGLFFAPAWSPQGNRWLSVLAEGTQDQLHSFQQDQVELVDSVEDGQIVFAWSPQGDRVAYALREGPDPIFSPVHIFNLATQQSRRITEAPFRIFAFFWSPDGQRLAYLTKLIPDVNRFQWRVFDLAKGEDRGFVAFRPSFQMQFMISSFNQYGQSHRFWSPDSRFLVYADRNQQLVERIWLLDTRAEAATKPMLVSRGSIGVWSWQ